MSKAASTAILAELHSALAAAMLDVIKNGVILSVDDEGNEVRRKASAAEWGAIISFLKNNSITADMEEDDELRELNAHLRRVGKSKGFHIPGADLTQ